VGDDGKSARTGLLKATIRLRNGLVLCLSHQVAHAAIIIFYSHAEAFLSRGAGALLQVDSKVVMMVKWPEIWFMH
jgi:hypothetical protein